LYTPWTAHLAIIPTETNWIVSPLVSKPAENQQKQFWHKRRCQQIWQTPKLNFNFKEYVDYNHLLGRGWVYELGVNFFSAIQWVIFMCAFLIGGAFHVQCALTALRSDSESSSPSIHYYLFSQLFFVLLLISVNLVRN